MKKALSLLVIFFLFAPGIKSQSLHYAGLFPTIDHSGDLTKNLGYDFYYFAAFPLTDLQKPDPSKDASFLLFYAEQSLSYKLKNNFSITGSYVYQRENAVYDNFVNENRFYVQVKHNLKLRNANLTNRLRFDGRFIHNRVSNQTPFTHRVRYLVGFDRPLKSKKNNLYFACYEEAFFNTFNNAGAVYGENWAYAALGIKLNEKNKIETGLLYVTWNTGEQSWFNQYYFQFTWISHLSFIKNKSE